jgi:metal-responsive CopG/Arc/MetJ family transcriptional regulator
MKKAQKNHDRAPGETQITISLPQSLKDELTALAAQDERSRSKWIVRELKALVAHKRAELLGHKKRSSG